MAKAQKTVLVPLDQHIAAQKPVTTEVPKSHDRAPVTKEQSLVHPESKPVHHPVPYYLMAQRPEDGGKLFSFTEAWLQVAGLYDGKHISRDDAVMLAGGTTISYHTKNGNFEHVKEGMTLTVKGRNFFKARYDATSRQKVIPEYVEAFKSVLSTGKMDPKVVSSQHFVKKFA